MLLFGTPEPIDRSQVGVDRVGVDREPIDRTGVGVNRRGTGVGVNRCGTGVGVNRSAGPVTFAILIGLLGCAADPSDPSPSDALPVLRPVTPAPAALIDNPLAASIDAMLESAASRGTFAGSVIVVDDGRTVFERGYGWADRAGVRRPNAPDTLYRIGSVSKQFTAAGILALAADGKLSLDDAVTKWFPDYPRESLSRGGVGATIHHLLAHTSGIADGLKSTFYETNRWRRPLAPDAIIEAAQSLPMVATPGTTSAVNDYGYLLLGRILEKASGKPYEAFLRERFWTPQGMHDTGTILPSEKQDRAAVGYEMAGSRFYALAEQSAFGDPDCTLAFGYGQVFSTVRDLATWDRALTTDRALPRMDRERLFEPNLADYGYGWRIDRKGEAVVQWHDGALLPLGFTSYVARIPAKGRFVALLTNLDQEAIAPFERQVATLSADRSKRGVTYGVAPR